MPKKVLVAILGSTGYVGLELTKILSKHPNVEIVFLGSENNSETSIEKVGKLILDKKLPLTQLNKNFDYRNADTVFLSLPHGVSNEFVKHVIGLFHVCWLCAILF